MNFEHSSHIMFEFKHLLTSNSTEEMVNINVYMSVFEYTYTYTLRLSQLFTMICFQIPLRSFSTPQSLKRTQTTKHFTQTNKQIPSSRVISGHLIV